MSATTTTPLASDDAFDMHAPEMTHPVARDQRRPWPRCRLLAALVVLAGVSAIGCMDVDRPGFEIVNRLHVPIDVTYVRGGKEHVIVKGMLPGNSVPVNGLVDGNECANASLFATDGTSAVVATFPGPVCDGTQWEVAVPGSSEPPSQL